METENMKLTICILLAAAVAFGQDSSGWQDFPNASPCVDARIQVRDGQYGMADVWAFQVHSKDPGRVHSGHVRIWVKKNGAIIQSYEEPFYLSAFPTSLGLISREYTISCFGCDFGGIDLLDVDGQTN
jgi:hypothetical protein